jgi:outer membrane protein assembly factor BamB
VVGNHDLDYTGIGVEDLAEIFDPLGPAGIGRGGPRYSFDYRGCHFVVMNDRPITGLIRFTPSDIRWLRADLTGVKKDAPLLLFLHADLPEEDTDDVVELLQPFRRPVIFQGHAHSQALNRWGGVPVAVTGALYGGAPEAGSYRVVTVQQNRMAVKTRDFGAAAGAYEPEQVIEFPEPAPQLRAGSPQRGALVTGHVTITARTRPAQGGSVEYQISGFAQGVMRPRGIGRYVAEAPLPSRGGWHLLTLRFRGNDGTVTLAHTTFRVPGDNVHEAWTKDLGSAIQGAPVIWRDLAIVPTRDGGVYALQWEGGRVVWRRKPEQGQIIGGMDTDGGSLFYGSGRAVYACSARTGRTLWQTPLSGTLIAGLTLGQGKLYVPSGEHRLYCLDARDGHVVWQSAVGRPIMMEPATDGRRVVFGGLDGCVRCLEAASGRELWKTQVSSLGADYLAAPFWPPVLAGDTVIVSKRTAAPGEKNLLALSASTGETVWSGEAAGAALRLALSPDGEKLYAPGRSGLQRLAVKDGSLLWIAATEVKMSAGIATGDVVLVRDDHDLSCVAAATGKVLWAYRTSTGPQGTYYGPGAFAVRDRRVIVGTMDGRVIALDW